jgi:16S rRNA (cytosine967-C5)-methyltransferase
VAKDNTKSAGSSAASPLLKNDGLAARRFAAEVIEDVIKRRLPLDDRLDRLSHNALYSALSQSDRGLTRAIATAALRRYGTIRKTLGDRMPLGIPPRSGRLESILIAGCAQILVLDTPPHAAVDTSVSLAREDKDGKHFADLTNAVLRRIAGEKAEILANADPLGVDTPSWLADRWKAAYGAEKAALIAASHMQEPSIDLSVKEDAAGWAEKLEAVLMPTGSVRLTVRTAIPLLPGFEEGAWWVQDAAASIPAKLLRAKPGQRILDLCAAPGGKTAQLAQTGATITAVDRSATRMVRLQQNIDRLGLVVATEVAEAADYTAELFDGVLLDAPCSATGTIRRHPDVAWSKTLQDIFKLCALQARLLDRAATLVKVGGVLVYATCSLERDEGETQIERFLERNSAFQREPILAVEIGDHSDLLQSDLLTEHGDLRCLPCHWPHAVDRLAGMDGFFASRLVRHA